MISPLEQAKTAAGDCISVLARHGIQARPGRNIPCPLGTHEDRHPSFSVFDGGEKFRCFSCGAHGDALDLEAQLSRQPLREVIRANAGRQQTTPRNYTRHAPAPREQLRMKQTFAGYIAEIPGMDIDVSAEIWERSDWRPENTPAENPGAEAVALLRTLYTPEDCIFIGELTDSKNATCVKRRDEWIETFEASGATIPPFFCPNPVSPQGAQNANGELSFRTAANVSRPAYAVAENDRASLPEQARFWLKMIQRGFPVRALTYSGNKSLHAIFEATPGELPELKKIFGALGFDPQTFDIARLSRMPGHLREDTEKFQTVLYLKK